MEKYKATDKFFKLKDKFFGIHKINILESGGTIETNIENVPDNIAKTLQEVKIKKESK